MKISDWLQDASQPHAPVVLGRGQPVSRETIRGRAAALRDRLREEQATRVLVACEDCASFVVALLGCAASGSVALLPANRQAGTLERAASQADVVLADPGDGVLEGRAWSPASLAAASESAFERFDSDRPWIVLHTSGTTGAGKAIPKAVRHLEDEVAVLEQLFGAGLDDDTVFFGTAAPQHLYGLLFRILWPLVHGRPIHGETLLHASELLPRMNDAPSCVLVGTPAHLRRLRGLDALGARCRAVVSSGGPLPPETAAQVERELGRAPIEIFGSTETGGVAWRRQAGGTATAWRCLPGVEAGSAPDDGRLLVRSPFVSTGAEAGDAPEAFVMEDRVAFDDDGGFHLRGRADRTVKIGEKRIDLSELESRLRAHPEVQEAAALVIEPGGEPRVAAVVVPFAGAPPVSDREARRRLAQELQRALARDFERVVLPRSFRFVSELPRDERGKLPRSELEALFEPRRAAEALNAEVAPGRARQLLRVPENLAFLDGHFPGFPVVPGIAQLGWVVAVLEEAMGARIVHRVEALKFKEVLAPGQEFELTVEWEPDETRARFRLGSGDRVFATGRLELRQSVEG